jgi:uncharacterized repeat protein (TIGR03803 family)
MNDGPEIPQYLPQTLRRFANRLPALGRKGPKLKLNSFLSSVALALATFIAVVMLGGAASARDGAYRVIYKFQGSSDGCEPVSLPAVGKNGDLYGVTLTCGIYNLGTIFRLTAPRTRGGIWTKTVLYDFPGGKGGRGATSLVLGADGNLYGASKTIFELKRPTTRNGAWKYIALYTLNKNTDGNPIEGNLVFDAEGNLYGATELGGDLGCLQEGCGTVFELKRPTKNGWKWHFSVLYTFTGSPDAAEPYAGLTFDSEGNLYGTTFAGGATDWGAVYRLGHPAKKGQPWKETVLYSFDGGNKNIIRPEAPVIFDGLGNLYGTTALGGDPNCQGGFGCGVVFELSPPAKQSGTWTYANIHAFQGGNDGIYPSGYMVLDPKGNLYGTTQTGGPSNGGTVYRLSPSAENEATWAEIVLHGFTGSNGDGSLPFDGLTWGKWHDLYGTTWESGLCQLCGTVFELHP